MSGSIRVGRGGDALSDVVIQFRDAEDTLVYQNSVTKDTALRLADELRRVVDPYAALSLRTRVRIRVGWALLALRRWLCWIGVHRKEKWMRASVIGDAAIPVLKCRDCSWERVL